MKVKSEILCFLTKSWSSLPCASLARGFGCSGMVGLVDLFGFFQLLVHHDFMCKMLSPETLSVLVRWHETYVLPKISVKVGNMHQSRHFSNGGRCPLPSFSSQSHRRQIRPHLHVAFVVQVFPLASWIASRATVGHPPLAFLVLGTHPLGGQTKHRTCRCSSGGRYFRSF